MTDADASLLHDTPLTRTRRCRYGVMIYLPHDTFVGRSLDAYGEFSPGEAKLFKQIVRQGACVLDVGANIGAHTVLLAQLAGMGGRVIAFEPQRFVCQLLVANAMINGLVNIETRLAAAGKAPGTLVVPPIDYRVKANFGGVSLGAWDSGERVPVETIDSLDLEACNFMKIDVEGMEMDVLLGARSTILRHRPLLYLENEKPEQSQVMIEWLWSAGYRLYWHFSPYFSPENFLANSEDLFPGVISVNLLAVPRELDVAMSGFHEVRSSGENWRDLFHKPGS